MDDHRELDRIHGTLERIHSRSLPLRRCGGRSEEALTVPLPASTACSPDLEDMNRTSQHDDAHYRDAILPADLRFFAAQYKSTHELHTRQEIHPANRHLEGTTASRCISSDKKGQLHLAVSPVTRSWYDAATPRHISSIQESAPRLIGDYHRPILRHSSLKWMRKGEASIHGWTSSQDSINGTPAM
ncbi:hypothetical protein DOTSEDRAFT_71538 [Dothistroma septosporum NZE10]|uniref:Uncharacterized protein n=1 Tax=Dothistroma septosporum (strain NZE10 / CBS 128990) TaxID=675120 RepID=N1PTY0_DOTSN|nr:hypothetical protein DOTSEDRAFT_71538 [Dothistroma septosporum NZE10]